MSKSAVAITVILLGAATIIVAATPPGSPAAKPAAPPAAAKAEVSYDPNQNRDLKVALDSIWASRCKSITAFLSSDLLEGRGTGARGGDIAAEYIATEFALNGLFPPVPVDPNTKETSYFQQVPLVGVETDPNASTLAFSKGAQTITPTYPDQSVFWTET